MCHLASRLVESVRNHPPRETSRGPGLYNSSQSEAVPSSSRSPPRLSARNSVIRGRTKGRLGLKMQLQVPPANMSPAELLIPVLGAQAKLTLPVGGGEKPKRYVAGDRLMTLAATVPLTSKSVAFTPPTG